MRLRAGHALFGKCVCGGGWGGGSARKEEHRSSLRVYSNKAAVDSTKNMKASMRFMEANPVKKCVRGCSWGGAGQMA